jgi:hypothetical protein
MDANLPAVDSLRYGSLGSLPVAHTWDLGKLFDGEWSYCQAVTVDRESAHADRVVIITASGSPSAIVVTMPDGTVNTYQHHEHDTYLLDCEDIQIEYPMVIDETEWDQIFERTDLAEGPMMNYWYPCPAVEDNPQDAATKLLGLPLCVVEVDGEWGLALTGGGMDLTWEIIEAFVRLGQLPPAHFASGLDRAGDESHGKSEHDFVLIRAAARTLQAVAENANRDRNALLNAASKWSGGTFRG